jgi:hypothetical protein
LLIEYNMKKRKRIKYLILGLIVGLILISIPFILSTQFAKSHNEIVSEPIQEIDSRKFLLLKYLKSYGSPIAEARYVDIIVDVSDANNADYRINVGIMLAESALCKKPLKKYNCYGYMNNRQYADFEEALSDLTGKVSRQYSARYGWNLVGMGTAYGAHNPEIWARNVRITANKL